MVLRTALLVLALLVQGRAAQAQDAMAEQGWNPQEARDWHEATQGSRLLPLSWLIALEQPQGETPFLDGEHVGRLGYIPSVNTFGIPLPVGFAIDRRDESDLVRTGLRWRVDQRAQEDWVGLNCAACHTGRISYRGRTLLIEGAPGMGDFQALLDTLNASLGATLSDPDKWERFARKVLSPGRGDIPTLRSMLRGALPRLAAWQDQQHRLNHTELRYGPGRLDAFGHIFNKVALVADAPRPTPNPSDAPVSYPFLWNIHQLPRVQYNGIAANIPVRSPVSGATFDAGALGRNVGEVVGVFADVVVRADPGSIGGYRSSVDVQGLVALEQQLMRLGPPKWPEAMFGTLDAVKIGEGRDLFASRCAGCHVPLQDLRTPVPDRMSFFNNASAGLDADGKPKPNTKPGTDIWMACNAYLSRSAAGLMEGLPSGYLGSAPPLQAEAPLAQMLGTLVPAVLAGAKGGVAAAAAKTYLTGDLPLRVLGPRQTGDRIADSARPPRSERRRQCEAATSTLLGYKSRPLTGIWATPPYLHNGSVPTLHDLLLSPEERPATFRIGTREYDPVNVGFVTTSVPGNTFLFQAKDQQGDAIPGNDNAGHDYGNASLTPRQRSALVEFLKTL